MLDFFRQFAMLDGMDVDKFVSEFTAGMDKATDLNMEVARRLAVIDAMLTTIENRQTDENARIGEEDMEGLQAQWEAKRRIEMECQAELLRARISEVEASRQPTDSPPAGNGQQPASNEIATKAQQIMAKQA